jgi:hypothetical protein
MINRENFKPRRFLKKESFTIPELNGKVLVRELSAGELVQLRGKGAVGPEESFWICVHAILDEDGAQMFPIDTPEEVENSIKVFRDTLSLGTVDAMAATCLKLTGAMGDSTEPKK